MSVRVQGASRDRGRSDGVERSVAAAHLIAQIKPQLMPRLVDHGVVMGGRTAYLVEETVRGTFIHGRAQVRRAMTELAEQMHDVHRETGIDHTPLSAVVPDDFHHQWRHLVSIGLVDQGLATAVERLIAPDRLLEVSLCHGDLVASNILLTARGITLIDWEHAGGAPIAFDFAKMHINAGPSAAATNALDGALAGTVGHEAGHYTLAEQLALGHIVMLSRYRTRMAKARAAGRQATLEDQTRKRIAATRTLLQRPT